MIFSPAQAFCTVGLLSLVRISTTEVNDFFLEKSFKRLSDACRSSPPQSANEEDDDEEEFEIVTLEEKPRSQHSSAVCVSKQCSISSSSRAESLRVSSSNSVEEEDIKESVKELNAISHDGDEDAREALEEEEEINDFFGLKRMDEDDMKVER